MTLKFRPNPYVIFDRDGTLIDLVPYLVDLNKAKIKEFELYNYFETFSLK
jgi:phosphoglycolate phosphatase-like HAD superfamily hydrolase